MLDNGAGTFVTTKKCLHLRDYRKSVGCKEHFTSSQDALL